jgi:TonB family protein
MRTVLYLFLFLLGYEAAAQSKITALAMECSSADGVMPAYKIEFSKSGLVYFEGEKNALFNGRIQGKLAAGEWLKLVEKYKKREFLKLPNSYALKGSEERILHFTLVVNGVRKRIQNAQEGPDYLMMLYNDINALLGKKIVWNKKTFVEKVSFVPPLVGEEQIPPQMGMDEVVAIPDNAQKVNEETLTFVEEMPEFPGGQSALVSFLSKNIQYPAMARENGIQGKVFCGFVVAQDGTVKDVKLVRGIGGGCDEEAIRVLRMMPRWKPGKQQGKAVQVRYQLPINFKLN